MISAADLFVAAGDGVSEVLDLRGHAVDQGRTIVSTIGVPTRTIAYTTARPTAVPTRTIGVEEYEDVTLIVADGGQCAALNALACGLGRYPEHGGGLGHSVALGPSTIVRTIMRTIVGTTGRHVDTLDHDEPKV